MNEIGEHDSSYAIDRLYRAYIAIKEVSMVYRYKMRYCTFVLQRIDRDDWGIFIDGDTCYSACQTIEAAIDDIRNGCTGCVEWDGGGYLAEDVPEDIREWERIR